MCLLKIISFYDMNFFFYILLLLIVKNSYLIYKHFKIHIVKKIIYYSYREYFKRLLVSYFFLHIITCLIKYLSGILKSFFSRALQMKNTCKKILSLKATTYSTCNALSRLLIRMMKMYVFMKTVS